MGSRMVSYNWSGLTDEEKQNELQRMRDSRDKVGYWKTYNGLAVSPPSKAEGKLRTLPYSAEDMLFDLMEFDNYYSDMRYAKDDAQTG